MYLKGYRKEKMQAYKPGSVPFCNRKDPYHLSSPGFATRVNQSTHPDDSCITRATNGQFLNRGLFDLSTRKVYHAPIVTIGTVSSYLAFSPFPSLINQQG